MNDVTNSHIGQTLILKQQSKIYSYFTNKALWICAEVIIPLPSILVVHECNCSTVLSLTPLPPRTPLWRPWKQPFIILSPNSWFNKSFKFSCINILTFWHDVVCTVPEVRIYFLHIALNIGYLVNVSINENSKDKYTYFANAICYLKKQGQIQKF